jgi:hypothetical protein
MSTTETHAGAEIARTTRATGHVGRAVKLSNEHRLPQHEGTGCGPHECVDRAVTDAS